MYFFLLGVVYIFDILFYIYFFHFYATLDGSQLFQQWNNYDFSLNSKHKLSHCKCSLIDDKIKIQANSFRTIKLKVSNSG